MATQKGCYLSISLQFYAPCPGITLCKYINKAIRDLIVFMVYFRMPKLLSKKKKKEKKGKERKGKKLYIKLKHLVFVRGILEKATFLSFGTSTHTHSYILPS